MILSPVKHKADQQKGRFGGSPRSRGRYLTAEVKAVDSDSDWFRIRLRVFPEVGAEPINGTVTFYLHQSFAHDERPVRAKNGEATLVVYAYGAFTVGAVLDEGSTQLELDLATLANAPQEFKDR